MTRAQEISALAARMLGWYCTDQLTLLRCASPLGGGKRATRNTYTSLLRVVLRAQRLVLPDFQWHPAGVARFCCAPCCAPGENRAQQNGGFCCAAFYQRKRQAFIARLPLGVSLQRPASSSTSLSCLESFLSVRLIVAGSFLR